MQPGSGDVLQFLKAGIMEIPDVLVVTKADLGPLAHGAARDLSAALRSLGSTRRPCSRCPRCLRRAACRSSRPRSTHTARSSTSARRRVAARRAGALGSFASEYGERGVRALGGRKGARNLLAAQDPQLDEPALLALLVRALG